MTHTASNAGSPTDEAFESFVREVEPKLRRAFAALYGPEGGRDATGEALAYAWEHWSRVAAMENSTGYLYRVGQSKSRRRRSGYLTPLAREANPQIEPALLGCLERLSERQRVAVVLCAAYEWTISEAADLMGITRGSVQRHLDRGMAKLRGCLGTGSDGSPSPR